MTRVGLVMGLVAQCLSEVGAGMDKLKDPRSVRDIATDVAKIHSLSALDKDGQDVSSVDEGCLVTNILWR